MEYSAAREKMVLEQLVPRGISDRRVLEAFRKVPRHEFVPIEMRAASYADHPLPVGEGQTISQPYMVALMTQALGLTGTERILEIGSGSGYQAAILAELAKEIYSVERIRALAENADRTLAKLGYKNIFIHRGDGTLGWEEKSPFDGIIVTAAAPSVPYAYVKQLTQAGKIVIPVGTMYSQALTLIEKKNGGLVSADLGGCVFVPLVGKDGWKNAG